MREIKNNLVDQVSRNWNTYYLLLLKWKEHLQNAQYITVNQQNHDIYDAGIVDYLHHRGIQIYKKIFMK